MKKLLFIISIFIILFLPIFSFTNRQNFFIDNSSSNNNETILEEEKEEPTEINMLFLGDIMLGRYVETLSTNNHNYPFEKIDKNIFDNKDIVYCNFEGPITDPHYHTKDGSTVFSLPEYSVDILKQNNVNLVSLSNNHLQDHGRNGYLNTKKILSENNFDFFGSYFNEENLFIKKNINGKDIIFFGVNMINTPYESNLNKERTETLNELKLVREDNPNAFIIVFPHWGNEYKIRSNKIQQNLAHDLVDVGADLIIGDHPHVIQENEIYNGKIIFYSLGNFIFDQYFSVETQESIAVELKLNYNNKDDFDPKVSVNVIPLKSIKSQPQLIEEENKKEEFLSKYNLSNF